ncbi:MAG: methyltransferase family protein, partial [Rhodospirillales bacterium]
MALLKDQLAAQGSTMFRWRGFLPLALILPALIALPQSGGFEDLFGAWVEAIWDGLCLAISLAGLFLRAFTVATAAPRTSGRNTTEQRADSLNTTGLYSVVRNPLYLGNIVTLIGFLLAVKVWWLPILILPLAVAYYERIVLAEEAYLVEKFGGTYAAWARVTPAYFPDISLWKPPALSFSLPIAVRREYHGFYLIVVTLTLIEALTDIIGEGQTPLGWGYENPFWVYLFGTGTVAYLILRVLRKRTS